MNYLSILALLFISFSGFSQIPELGESKAVPPEILKCRDVRFRMVSDCANMVYFNEDNNAVIHKKSGKPYTGQCKVCHVNGNLEMFLTFNGGRPVGQDTIWYNNGAPNLIRSHDTEGMGKEDGQWKLYRTDGSLKWEKSYVMGAEDGESRYYYPDSTLWKIEVWSVGELNGKKQEFYKNNSVKKEIDYKNGEWNGKYITYFGSGMVESEQEYVMGKKEGLSKYYYETGALLYEEYHENGCREGETSRFYLKDNRKWTVENYKKNIRHGVFQEYFDNDKNTMKYQATYKKGVLIDEKYYDEFGDEVAPAKKEEKPFSDTEGEISEKDLKKWPENPTDDFLAANKVTRKQYDKYRKKYFKYKAKEKKKEGKGVSC